MKGNKYVRSFGGGVVLLSVAFLVASPDLAHAGYLDPGSGSTAVQWIIASITAVGRLKRKIVGAVSRIFGR